MFQEHIILAHNAGTEFPCPWKLLVPSEPFSLCQHVLHTVTPRRLRLCSQTVTAAWGLSWDPLGWGLVSNAVLFPGVVHPCANTLEAVELLGAGSHAGKDPLL